MITIYSRSEYQKDTSRLRNQMEQNSDKDSLIKEYVSFAHGCNIVTGLRFSKFLTRIQNAFNSIHKSEIMLTFQIYVVILFIYYFILLLLFFKEIRTPTMPTIDHKQDQKFILAREKK